MKPLDRPICSIDIESTGTDPAVDRIVQIGILRIGPYAASSETSATTRYEFSQLINPGIPIPPKATEIHHITDEMVRDMPYFKGVAQRIQGILSECDLIGFNLIRFDVPIIWEELHRAGLHWDLTGIRIVDAGAIFMKKQPRTLTEALRVYAGITERIGAHDALADAMGTWDVFKGQVAAHPDIAAMSMDELHAFSKFSDNIDLAGKLVMIDGRPCYGFGKNKGTPICEDMGYAHWMLQKDFSANTKMHLREICEGILAEERSLYRQNEQNETSPF